MPPQDDTPAGAASGFGPVGPLLEAVPAALALVRAPGFRLEAVNGDLLRLLDRGPLVGESLLELFAPEDAQRVAKILREVCETGEPRSAQEVELRPGAVERRAFLDWSFRRAPGDASAVLGAAVNVTDRVRARSSVQLEQLRLEAVFANVSAALAIVRGPEAIFEKTNESYERLFIHRPLLGKPLLDALPELKGQKFPELIAQVFATGQTYSEREARALLRRTGEGLLEERYFDQSYTRITDPAGRPYGVLIQAVDVTERVQSRARLEAEADKNARLLRYMPTAFFSLTREWVLNYMNPAAEEVLGLRAAEVTGKSLWEIFPGLAESRFGEAYLRSISEGVRLVVEDYYPPYDRWYEAWAYPFDGGLAVSFFDVTQRKKDELRHKAEKEKLEAIFHGSASPMVFFRGPELVYEMVNERYQELVPGRELVEKPLALALPELQGTAFPQLIARVFRTGTPVVTHEERAPLLNPLTGEIEDRFFDSGVSRINDGEGKPYGVFVQATEVTERVQSRKRIEEALAARDTFLSIASHELRTPITAMRLQAQMMKRALSKGDPGVLSLERVKKLVDQTDQGLTRMIRLVEDMLDIARIRTGKLALDREPADLVSLVRDVLHRFSDELDAAGIGVSLRAEPGRMDVVVDRFRMEQVLTNLITNAIKYAPRAPVAIQLTAADGRFQLAFQDGGPGIAERDRERIFQRFERLGPANHVSGLGLGLYIVREILEAQGGRIRVEGSAGTGARFVLELPAAERPGAP